jgi:hypothetical protein
MGRNPLERLMPEGDCPSAVAQYEVAKAQPAEANASDSPRNGGFCHSHWAPWLQAESW